MQAERSRDLGEGERAPPVLWTASTPAVASGPASPPRLATLIRAVIFDMDGVLTDSEPLINAAAIAMFRERGLTVQPEDFHPFVGTGENRYIGGVAEKYQLPLDIVEAKRRTYEIYLELVPTRLEAFPGAVELVRACRQAGLKTAVASSADRIKIDANLHQIGLPPEGWDAVITGDDVVRKKPAPDIFLAAARQLGLPPESCVVIEDAVNGVQAAQAAGIRCVAVAHSFSPAQLQAADLVRLRIAEVTPADLLSVPPQRPVDQAGPAARLAQGAPPVLPQAPVEAPSTAPPPAPGRPWGFWATLGLAVIIALIALAAEAVVGAALFVLSEVLKRPEWLEGLETSGNGLVWALATFAATPAAVLGSAFFAWLRKGIRLRQYLALKPLPAHQVFRWCVATLGLVLLSDLTTTLLQRPIVPDVMVNAYRTAGFTPLLWLALIIGAPLGEEFFFRGFLFKGWVHSRLGGAGTVILTSLAWAAIHQQYQLYEMTMVFVTGLLLGYARLRTNSIYPPLVMHALMNFLATLQVMAYVGFVG